MAEVTKTGLLDLEKELSCSVSVPHYRKSTELHAVFNCGKLWPICADIFEIDMYRDTLPTPNCS